MLYYMLYHWQTSVAPLCHNHVCSRMLPYAIWCFTICFTICFTTGRRAWHTFGTMTYAHVCCRMLILAGKIVACADLF